ncbi:MAG: efflux RND transporter periplasmic adaptor subunit [Candidatus Aminicenantes bacterium]|nr:efflux RND transporter periplasmic adaptor subunit [Candidatus Aminicenantes bacterium]
MIFSKKILTFFLIIVICGAIVFFFVYNKKSESKSSDMLSNSSGQKEALEETPLPVKVEKAQKGNLIIKLKSPGEAITDRKIIMKAEVAGKIKSLNAEESRHVKKGEILLEIEDEEYKLELESQEADRLRYLSEILLEKKFGEYEERSSRSGEKNILEAEKEYEKARQLFQKGLISTEEFEKKSKQYELALIESGEKKEEIRAAAKGLTQAEIRVKKAKMTLEKTKIRAPFYGIVYEIKVSLGEHVSNGSELFTLINIERIKVHAKVLESEIRKMKVGREVELTFSSYPEKSFKGTVKAISPIVNPEDKTCKVIIDVANPGEEIKPGMHVDVEIASDIYEDRLLIPQESVLVRGGRKMAFIVENGLAKWRYIQVGFENEDFVEVLEGIEEGEQVITEGHLTLAHDAKVNVIE